MAHKRFLLFCPVLKKVYKKEKILCSKQRIQTYHVIIYRVSCVI